MKSTILFLASSPTGEQRLALDKECRAIREKLRSSDFPRDLELKTEWAVRPKDLLQYLSEYRPHVVHFSGHGSDSEELILQDENDNAKPVGKTALRALFATLKDKVRLVVLNACFSRPQAEAIVEVVDCAVGMKNAIGDKAAIEFAASFYSALGFGRSVQEAFDQGCAALLLEGIPEEKTPELLVKKGVDATKVVLVHSVGSQHDAESDVGAKRKAIEKWLKKRAFLEEQEALISDPAQKFTLHEQIEEAIAKIKELRG